MDSREVINVRHRTAVRWGRDLTTDSRASEFAATFINSSCPPPQDTSSRSLFDPTSQHRDWCPWVKITLGKEARENGGTAVDASTLAEPGWKAVLNILLAHKQSNQPAEADSLVR